MLPQTNPMVKVTCQDRTPPEAFAAKKVSDFSIEKFPIRLFASSIHWQMLPGC